MQFVEDSRRPQNDGRRKLAKLMVINGVTQRELAQAIGWKAHSYLGRLIRGEVKTVDPDAAVRIAHYFGVTVDDLFISKASSDTQRPVASRRTRGAA